MIKKFDRRHSRPLKLILNDYESLFYPFQLERENNSPTSHKHFISQSTEISKQPLPGINK